MNKVLYIILISLFSFTVISCSEDKEESTTDTTTTTTTTSSPLFVSVGNAGTILTSSDGISWYNRTSGTTEKLRAVAYDNSTLVVVGKSGTILTSSDGTTWTSRTYGTNTLSLYDVTYKE